MKSKNFFNYSFYDLYTKLKFYSHKLKTIFWYGLFLRQRGKGAIIVNPILLSPNCLSLGENVFIRNGARIEGVFNHNNINYDPSIILGNNVSIEQNAHITCANKILIGANTAIGANVTISDINHIYEDINLAPAKQGLVVEFIEIGKNCTICINSVILPGTKLGDNCLIGANSVVKPMSYPENCVLAGSPAKIVKRYDAKTNIWRKTNFNGEFI